MAAAKKTFAQDLNPALSFISRTDAVVKTEEGETRFVFNTPEQEAKSRRVQLLIKPSLYDRIKAAADRKGASVNALMNALLEYALQEEEKQ